MVNEIDPVVRQGSFFEPPVEVTKSGEPVVGQVAEIIGVQKEIENLGEIEPLTERLEKVHELTGRLFEINQKLNPEDIINY